MITKSMLIVLDCFQIIDCIEQGALDAAEVRATGVEYSYHTEILTNYLNYKLGGEDDGSVDLWGKTKVG